VTSAGPREPNQKRTTIAGASEPNQTAHCEMEHLVTIGLYETERATCKDHDPRALQVAALVARMIESRLPGVVVEHVGSTAVPGCAGKAVVDLMGPCPAKRLPKVSAE